MAGCCQPVAEAGNGVGGAACFFRDRWYRLVYNHWYFDSKTSLVMLNRLTRWLKQGYADSNVQIQGRQRAGRHALLDAVS